MTVQDGTKPKRRKRAKKQISPTEHRGESPAARARAKGLPCGRCLKHHLQSNGKPSCNGHKKHIRPYVPCPRPPINGGAVCRQHGGAAPLTARNAKMRVVWTEATGEVAQLMKECDIPDQHPINGLLEVVRHTGAMMRLLSIMVGQLDNEPEVTTYAGEDGVIKAAPDTALFGYDHNSDQKSHVLVMMYGQWSDRYARACKLALDANIDERLVRNAESTNNALFNAVGKALEKAHLDPAQEAAFTKTLASELRKLAGPIDEMRIKA